MSEIYDLAILGAGPAGISAAIYAARAQLNTLWVEKKFAQGGQIVDTYEVDNYPDVYKRQELILTTGGTGFSERDVMPEATEDIIERRVPGIPEAMRAYSMTITKRAMLSRASAGIRKKTLIINLPGSPKAVRENLEYIIDSLEHGIEILTGEASDCARK